MKPTTRQASRGRFRMSTPASSIVAVGRLDQPEHRPHRRRLAGAVRADQPADLARADLQREVVDGADVVVIDPEVVDADHRRSSEGIRSGPATVWRPRSAVHRMTSFPFASFDDARRPAMKLGFNTAILADQSLEAVLDLRRRGRLLLHRGLLLAPRQGRTALRRGHAHRRHGARRRRPEADEGPDRRERGFALRRSVITRTSSRPIGSRPTARSPTAGRSSTPRPRSA